MGYTSSTFLDVKRCGIPAGGRVFDIGSQDTHLSSAGDLHAVNQFVGREAFTEVHPEPMPARAVYEKAGYTYYCSDVDKRPGTIYVDLNQYVFPEEYKGTMDVVTNCGTSEHLLNPLGLFAFMHYLAKPGAILFHDVPISGFANHGLCNLTPKFWHFLQIANAYQLLTAKIRRCDEELVPGNYYGDHLSNIQRADTLRDHAMIRFVVRKVRDRFFIPPWDVDAAAELRFKDATATIIRASLSLFQRTGVASQKDIDECVADYFAEKEVVQPGYYL